MGTAYNFWLYRVRRRVFLRIVRSWGIRLNDAQVIDIGCGTGFYIQRWKELGVRTIVGIDLTRVSVETLRNRFPDERFYQLDIGGDTLSPLEQSEYDAVSAFDVLFHIPSDQRYRAAMRNIYSLVRAGGWFVFSENFLHREAERTEHQVSRSLSEITDLVHQAGFRIICRTPLFVLMNDPVDQPSTFLRHVWQVIFKPVCKANLLGMVWGAALYPWELLLTRYLKEGPTTEVMVCQKPE